MNLNISLAFTYRRHGIDVILAQQRIEFFSLDSSIGAVLFIGGASHQW
jgi:hypothetical protein